MRFILVDSSSDEVSGDTSKFAAGWPELTSDNDNLGSLCRAAAQLLDESKGEPSSRYEFTSFEPSDKASGYFVFMANEKASDTLGKESPSIYEVLTQCSYVGYVVRSQAAY